LTFRDRLARFNRWLPNRIIGTVAGRRLSPVAFVVHQGRRSGRHHRTPVMPLPLEDGFLVSLPYGHERDWVRNVQAAGRCTIVRGGRRFELTDPRLLDAAQAAPLLPAPLRPAVRVVSGMRFLRLSQVL
jgi:deazaflavin-dependent oxidoreductase (nitroreductase family)